MSPGTSPLPTPRGWLTPFRIVLLYAAFGCLWILFSDRFLELLVRDPDSMTTLQTAKGWFFVLGTALMLYGLIRSYASSLALVGQALRESEYKLLYRSLHDEVTGLPNRAFFLSLLEEKIHLCQEGEDCDYSVLLLDLDRFKVVNDSLGHFVGDKLVSGVAARLKGLLTPLNTIARLGGDEFAVLAVGRNMVTTPLRLATQIKDALRAPFVVDGIDLSTSASIGIVICTCDYTRPEHILRDADTAMHRAKLGGPGSIEVFQTQLHEQAMRVLRLESDLRKSLERQELLLYYQPVVALKDGRIVGMEALIRWPRPEGFMILPTEFIPLAEDTGLILGVGSFAFMRACIRSLDLRRIVRPGDRFFISVNVSSPQIMQPDFMDVVRGIIEKTGADPKTLKFEITESGAMKNAPVTIEVFTQLREMGFGLAIDDFGTGYSSLSYLRRFPLDTLKVDQSFVRGLEASPENQRIVQAVITLAQSLGLSVIAEGVETQEARAILVELGCEYGQGYLFDRPLPGEKIMERMQP